MGNRTYRRDSHGRFAGSGGGATVTTTGRAGGFANASHRANVAQARNSAKINRGLTQSSVPGTKAGRNKQVAKRVAFGVFAPKAGSGLSANQKRAIGAGIGYAVGAVAISGGKRKIAKRRAIRADADYVKSLIRRMDNHKMQRANIRNGALAITSSKLH